MNYKVIYRFMDLQDFNHIYQVGDKYPRHGAMASQARIKELASTNNKIGKPLIAPILSKVVEPVDLPKTEYTKTAINRMPTAELQELATRENVANANELTGAELKKILIEKYGL